MLAIEEQARPLMTRAEILEQIPVDASTLYRWTKAGRFPRPINGGRGCKTLWNRKEVEAWLRLTP